MNAPHQIMTEEEYFKLRLKGAHVVCKDYRNEVGCVAIWYLPDDGEYPTEALDRHGHVPALRRRQEVARCLTCGRSDSECKRDGFDCIDPWHADDHLRRPR